MQKSDCRICGGSLGSTVIDLGEQYLQGAFERPNAHVFREKYPTALAVCPDCGLLQREMSVDPVMLYSQYFYQSGTNATMRQHLDKIACEAITTLHLSNNPIVLDIGCNDGTLLSCFPSECTKIGIDPSNVAFREHARSIKAMESFELVGELFPSNELLAVLGKRKVDIVTAIAMFYDLDAPVQFVEAVNDILAPGGVFVLEVSYLPWMLQNNSYDTICAEHIEYYTFTNLKRILEGAGLRPFRTKFSTINGGSIRVHACRLDETEHDQKEWLDDMDDIIRQEELNETKFPDFQKRIEEHRLSLLQLLASLRSQDKTVHVYGASTKGNTILQWCGITNELIPYAADRNPQKHGCHTLGSNIEIISEEESRAMQPDYYLVLPWHFKYEFMERERDMLAAGTKMIFPLPNVSVVGA